jgi:hypothetical protein
VLTLRNMRFWGTVIETTTNYQKKRQTYLPGCHSVTSTIVLILRCADFMTDAGPPVSRSKSELETLVKQNGGAVFQSEKGQKDIIVIAERGSYSNVLSSYSS